MELKEKIINSEDFAFFRKSSSHSILLTSQDEFYCFAFAQLLASFIMDGDVCADSENYKKIMSLSHPDVKYFPTKEKLLVSDSEELVFESFVKPIFATKKIFIIKNIDNSMESAQNKLLKILEEPPQNVYIILTCSNREKVLPTIRSRCVVRELSKYSKQEIAQIVKGSDASMLAICLSDGSIGQALVLSKKDNLQQIAEFSINILTKMQSSKQVLRYSNEGQAFIKDINFILKIITYAIEDMLNLKVKNEKIRLDVFEDELRKASDNYTVKALCMINRKINDLQKEISYNVMTQIAFENFLLNVLEVKYLCK